MFGVNSFDILRSDNLFRATSGRLFALEGDPEQNKGADDEQPDEYGSIGDAGGVVPAGANKECPPCMKPEMRESIDEDGNRVEKYVCVPACDAATGEVCYIHPCVNNQGWTCLKPQKVGGGGNRIVFPTNLTTTCGEEGYTGNNKACPCVVCNDAISISKCGGDCKTCSSHVQGATNIGQGANGQSLCGNSIGNVLVSGAGQGQGVSLTPPSGTTSWGFIEDKGACQCPAGAQKIDAPEICPDCERCANVGCTDPTAENYDSNATVTCGEGTLWPNRCCTYSSNTPSCDDSNACNRHFTDGANMDCMRLGNNCEPICADSRSVDYAGRQAEASAKTLKELYYYEESAKYDWSQSGKPMGDKEHWATMTSKLSGADSQARQTLANKAVSLFFKPCACPEGETWSDTYSKCVTLGCTDTRACNWNSGAKADDGSCEFENCNGCMIIGSKNYDSNATIPCLNDAGKQTCCNQTDNSPIPYSCTYDDFCRWLPSYCTGKLTGCVKGYKQKGGVCVRCDSDDSSLECKEGCSEESGRKFYGSSLVNGLSRYKIGGISMLTWGLVGLIAGGAYVATQE